MSVVKNLPENAGDVSSIGKIPWRQKWQTHSSILAWEKPWTEEPGGLQSMGLQKSWPQLSNSTTKCVWETTKQGLATKVQTIGKEWVMCTHYRVQSYQRGLTNDIWEAWDRVDMIANALGFDIEDLYKDVLCCAKLPQTDSLQPHRL